MRRREVVAALATLGCPSLAFGQGAKRPFRIGVLMDLSERDSEAQARLSAFRESLTRPALLDVRWAEGDLARMREYAAELVALAPDVILSSSSVVLQALDQVTRSIPIVFVVVADPVGQGFVASVSRPGGNKTGFISWDLEMAEKWVELLKLAAPKLGSIAALYGAVSLRAFETIGRAEARLGVRVLVRRVLDGGDIDRVFGELATMSDVGLVVAPSPVTIANRAQILALAERGKIPAMYPYRFFADEGGLMSYGIDAVDLYRRAAAYVERIGAGENVADLPVQRPARFHFVMNLRTASKLDLTLAPSFLARADEVIE